MKASFVAIALLAGFSPAPSFCQSLALAEHGQSHYAIYLPASPTAAARKSASILNDYFRRVTGIDLPIRSLPHPDKAPGIFLEVNSAAVSGMPEDGFLIRSRGADIAITGKGAMGLVYGTYRFIDRFLGCRKLDGGPAFVPKRAELIIPGEINEVQSPAFVYREIYFPPAFDREYLDWHRLNRFEEEWGLWGHSFFKLVDPAVYFRPHPEYFSLVNNHREARQLCLSNPDILRITIARLSKLISENPQAKYWSISQNDDDGFCQCGQCSKLDAADGGPQGSLIHFVNQVAAHFPDQTFTTLAYGYSHRAPLKTRPAGNVIVMLSSIDAGRTLPLREDAAAASFRKDLREWGGLTPRLFAWDYCAQFTSFLTPFPVASNFASDFNFLNSGKVSGIFEEGSGDTYSDLSGLKSYVGAELLWDPQLNADSLMHEFIDHYYGKAGGFVNQYLDLLHERSRAVTLDIYGNPVNNSSDYLSPANMDRYSTLMDQAETMVAGDSRALAHIHAIRLGHEFVVLQQARFFGKDRFGIFDRAPDGSFAVKANLPERVSRFVKDCSAEGEGIRELSEGGISPAAYKTEWDRIFSRGPQTNLAADAKVSLAYPFAPEYPAKRERTLVDETPGYDDFSYNWLCFYEVPMEATIDLGAAKKLSAVSLHFLSDPRHYIFIPSSVTIETSTDGRSFSSVKTVNSKPPDEDYSIEHVPYSFELSGDARYVRVRALNQPALPSWRFRAGKKPMIACDEVWVR